MEIFGRGYIIEHCISTFKILQKENLYRSYMADILRALLRNPEVPRYSDLIADFHDPKEKNPDPEEIKDRIKNGLNKLRGK